jgi:hypothetical protein
MATANRPIPVRIAPEHVHVHAGLTPQDRADIERFKRLAPGEILNVVTMALLACRLHMKAIREQAI